MSEAEGKTKGDEGVERNKAIERLEDKLNKETNEAYAKSLEQRRRLAELNRIDKAQRNRFASLFAMTIGLIFLLLTYLQRTNRLSYLVDLFIESTPWVIGSVIVVSSTVAYISNTTRIADIDLLRGFRTKKTTLSPQEAWPFPTGERPDEIAEAEESFQSTLYEITSSLSHQASISDEKASTLLDKGMTYAIGGIIFFGVSILVWQSIFHFIGFNKSHIYGMVSCATLFLAIELISAWFLKQYRNYVDAATELRKIKAIFDKFLLMKLVSEESEPSNSLNNNLADLLARDIVWPETGKSSGATGHIDIKTMSYLVSLFKNISDKKE